MIAARKPLDPDTAPPVLAHDREPGAGAEAPRLERVAANDDRPRPAWARRGSGRVAAALLLSIGLHSALLAFFVAYAPRPGVDADADAVTVEIVIEEETPIAEQSAPAEQPPEPSVDTVAIDLPPLRAQLAAPPDMEAAPASLELPAFPEHSAELSSAPPSVPPLAVLAAPAPPEASAELLAAPPEVAQADPALPQSVPLPTRRPANAEEARQTRPTKRPRRERRPNESHGAAKLEPPDAPRRQRPQQEDRSQARAGAGAAASAGRKASAGETRAYARRLTAHLERHKRYPREAERQRVSGATKLAVTIDRSGRLAGARVAGSSGHAVLDGAALEAARRAAPYPRPPEAIGGATVAISVTLRFKPRR